MAARSVYKLFAKTYNCPLTSTYSSSTYSTLPPNGSTDQVGRQQRSYSQPSKSPARIQRRREKFTPQLRNISRSLQNLRDTPQKNEVVYVIQDDRSDYNNFPVADLSVREPAKEFKEKYVPEERTEEGNPIYEIAEGSRTQENFFDVINFMTQIEKEKSLRVFPHLQPSNIKPFGSTENLHIQDMYRKKMKIVYPVVNTTAPETIKINKRPVSYHHKEYSSYRKPSAVICEKAIKVESDFGSYRKPSALSEEISNGMISSEKTARSQKDVSKMNYSTACLTARKVALKPTTDTKPPKLSINSSLAKKSSTSLLKKKKREKFPSDDVLELNRIGIMDQFYKRAKAYRDIKDALKISQENFVKSVSRSSSASGLLKKSKTDIHGRTFNTYAKSASAKSTLASGSSTKKLRRDKREMVEDSRKPQATSSNKSDKPADVICEEYVTVKLGELKEECRRVQKCKPKICFGKLPKLTPPDCPCFEDYPLKEGKPLTRLQKRFEVKPKARPCAEVVECITPRADANYKIKMKTLPQLIPADCPCEDREMIDFNIKRLPKVKVPEPPRICATCDDTACCNPVRADDKLKIEKKSLPKLEVNDCPCIEPPPMKDVPLAKLKPNPVKEPVRYCPPPEECPSRADDNLKVKQKTLPVLQPGCICVEPPPMDDVPPLTRLKKFKVKEPSRPTCYVEPCEDAVRADSCYKIQQKKLPVFVPQDCPCIEERIPSDNVKLKRLVKRPVSIERKEICVIKEECPPRADEGMVIKSKQLPTIVPGDCPCNEQVIEDVPPLKKLIPKPVEEPRRVCTVEEECPSVRADSCYKIEKKSLPVLPLGDCPCIEPEPPLDVPPLPKLKKRPVVFKRVCVVEEPCPPRADEDLKVKIKKLPPLKVPDCPCIEPPPPDDVKPLKRLKKVHIPEPPRVCASGSVCDEIQRADETDWLYWKRVEVKCKEPKTPAKTSKKNFSTSIQSKRFYGTGAKYEDDFFFSKYDVSNLRTNKLMGKSYDIIIDIKPSAPLILTQTPIGFSSCDHNKEGKSLKRSKSEPIDRITFIIYKTNSLVSTKSKSGVVKDSNDGVNVLCNNFSRFISTCSTLYDQSDRPRDKSKEHYTPNCECPPNDRHLQPNKPILPDREIFIEPPYPSDDVIDETARRSRVYCNERKDGEGMRQGHDEEGMRQGHDEECQQEEVKAAIECEDEHIRPSIKEAKEVKPLSLWERIVNYFKARPCPSPEEFKKMRLREDAEKAAAKAGLCLYDPKEMLHKNENELPKVITAGKAEQTGK